MESKNVIALFHQLNDGATRSTGMSQLEGSSQDERFDETPEKMEWRSNDDFDKTNLLFCSTPSFRPTNFNSHTDNDGENDNDGHQFLLTYHPLMITNASSSNSRIRRVHSLGGRN